MKSYNSSRSSNANFCSDQNSLKPQLKLQSQLDEKICLQYVQDKDSNLSENAGIAGNMLQKYLDNLSEANSETTIRLSLLNKKILRDPDLHLKSESSQVSKSCSEQLENIKRIVEAQQSNFDEVGSSKMFIKEDLIISNKGLFKENISSLEYRMNENTLLLDGKSNK